MRKLRASISTLAMTPGVLSVYKTKILEKVGGFDEGNITEDFEIAMRLKYYGYSIQLEPKSVTYTIVPNNFKSLWDQRLRWFRGYLYNHYKYRNMFFSKKDKMMGYFQLPLNIIGIILLITTIVIVSYGSLSFIQEIIIRSTLIKSYLPSLIQLPSLKEFILRHNIKIMFPIYMGMIAGLYLFYVGHKILDEKFRYPFSMWGYFVIFPYMTFSHWVFSIFHEILKLKRKW